MKNKTEYFACFCGISVDGESITLLVSKFATNKIQLWLHCDFVEEPQKDKFT